MVKANNELQMSNCLLNLTIENWQILKFHAKNTVFEAIT